MKKISIVLSILFALTILNSCNGEKRDIVLPDSDNLIKIRIEKFEDDDYRLINEFEGEDVEKILNKVKSESKFYSDKSVNDIPTNIDIFYTMKSVFSEDMGEGIAHIYKNKGKYFIEQPYNGIWTLPEEVYNDLTSEL
ncbi:MAG: DUF5301 domain-containing protein [Tissierellia bacterium]|nr:DUF5301 domain-containing protein [Tissierellia bacterium]